MVNLRSTDDSRYIGFHEITDRIVLDLQCITNFVVVSSVFISSPELKVSYCDRSVSIVYRELSVIPCAGSTICF